MDTRVWSINCTTFQSSTNSNHICFPTKPTLLRLLLCVTHSFTHSLTLDGLRLLLLLLLLQLLNNELHLQLDLCIRQIRAIRVNGDCMSNQANVLNTHPQTADYYFFFCCCGCCCFSNPYPRPCSTASAFDGGALAAGLRCTLSLTFSWSD